MGRISRVAMLVALHVLVLCPLCPQVFAQGCHGPQDAESVSDGRFVAAQLRDRKREDRSFRAAVKEAIKRSSDLSSKEKLRLRLAMALRPGVASAIEDHLVDVVSEQGVAVTDVEAQFDLDDFERLLQILIEYLPQLIEIFMGLFGESSLAATDLGAVADWSDLAALAA